jgi:hypothetical protein
MGVAGEVCDDMKDLRVAKIINRMNPGDKEQVPGMLKTSLDKKHKNI